MISLAMCLVVIAMLALAFECVGAAWVLFFCGLLCWSSSRRSAYAKQLSSAHVKWSPLFGLKSQDFLRAAFKNSE